METTTPKNIDDKIKEFAEHIRRNSSNELQYINITPDKSSLAGNCFYNVANKVITDGGEIQYGWIIWKWGNLMLEAEFHSIWKSNEGNFIDITPTEDGENQILFLPEYDKKFKGEVINNIRYPLIDNLKLNEYINTATKITDIRNKLRSDAKNEKYIEEIMKLSQRMDILHYELLNLKLTKNIGRNDKCFCGSGKKYKKCCFAKEG